MAFNIPIGYIGAIIELIIAVIGITIIIIRYNRNNKNKMKIGLSHTTTIIVNQQNIASQIGSGTLDVFATPAMIALMENAAYKAVENVLSEGESTVGTAITASHTKASPIGETIEATATLITIDARKLIFEITAKDSTGIIGQSTHERFIINIEKFLSKIER